MDSLILLLITLIFISFLGLKLMDNIDLSDLFKKFKFKSIFSKIKYFFCNINIKAICSYIKSKQKIIGAVLVLICLSIGYALTLGNVISTEPSVNINWKALRTYALVSFYAFACAGLFFNELNKHEDL